MTDRTSTKKVPEAMNNGKNIPDKAAIAANAPPSAKDPVSPIKMEALYLLWNRNPTQAPAIEDPKTARSVGWWNSKNIVSFLEPNKKIVL